MELDGFLLVGGRSRRMGSDKALLELEGLPFAERIAREMPCARVRVAGRARVAALDGVEDLRPGEGPLAGIETALTHCGTEAALIVACDMPFVTRAFLLLVAGRAASAPGRIVVARDPDGRLAPLCGVYPRAALAVAAGLLDSGERKVRALIDRVPTLVLDPDAYAHLPGARELLRNVNTPEEYRAAVVEPGASGSGGMEPLEGPRSHDGSEEP